MKGARGMYPFLNIYKFPQWRFVPICLEGLFPRREKHPPSGCVEIRIHFFLYYDTPSLREQINTAPSRSGNPNSSHPPHTG